MYSYYMFHKPYGCVTARRDNRYPTVMDYFKQLNNENLSPVGRLDRETEGLLVITDDGKWNQLMTNPANQKEKVYKFIALGTMDEEKKQQLESGVMLIGAETPTKPAKVTITGTSVLKETLPLIHPEIQKKICKNLPDHPTFMGKITVTEGRNHQVRRMLKAVGCCIISLKRVSMGEIVLDKELAPGQWKEITVENL